MINDDNYGLSNDSLDALSELQRKNKQSRLAGMTGATQTETAGAVEGIIKGNAAGKATRERTMLEYRNAADQVALKREEIAGHRADEMAGMAQQNEQWNTVNNINDRRHSEQRKDALQQRKIKNITTVGSALGTGVKAYYKPTWGGAIKSWFAKFMPAPKQKPTVYPDQQTPAQRELSTEYEKFNRGGVE